MTTYLVSGSAAFLTATGILILSLRLAHREITRPSRLLALAAALILLGSGVMAMFVNRALLDGRAPGEILGIIAGANYVLAAAFTFRAWRLKRPA